MAHYPMAEGARPWYHRLPRTRLIPGRDEWLCAAAADKRVVHIGFADIGCEVTRRASGLLHERLAAVAADLVGLDVVPAAVEAAKKAGYDAYAVDCTSPNDVAALDLGRFDVVLLGEVIEHVDHAGGLLRTAEVLVGAHGVLIVTTPNARRPIDVLLAAVGRESIHPDHVALYSPRTLSALLERHHWTVETLLTYANPAPRSHPRSAKSGVLRALGAAQRRFARVAPYCADGLIVAARRATMPARAP
jgi:SAM-dependent methyltransferase